MSINLKNIHISMIAISVICLSIAYISEYIFSFAPCPLCIYQRYPYFIFIFLAILGLSTRTNAKNYYFIVAFTGLIIASYHVGIERGIFELSALCKPAISIKDNMTVDSFKEMLYSNSSASCSKATLIFGVSMAEWNLLLNIGIIIMLYNYYKNNSSTGS